jgi:hypothetical protein
MYNLWEVLQIANAVGSTDSRDRTIFRVDPNNRAILIRRAMFEGPHIDVIARTRALFCASMHMRPRGRSTVFALTSCADAPSLLPPIPDQSLYLRGREVARAAGPSARCQHERITPHGRQCCCRGHGVRAFRRHPEAQSVQHARVPIARCCLPAPLRTWVGAGLLSATDGRAREDAAMTVSCTTHPKAVNALMFVVDHSEGRPLGTSEREVMLG